MLYPCCCASCATKMLLDLKSLKPIRSNAALSSIITFLWILFVFHPEDVSSIILKSPSNTTVIVGHRFELNCSANKATIQWVDWSFFRNSRLTNSDYNQPCTPSILSEADDEKCIKIVSSGEISESQEKRYNASNISTENEFSSTLSVEVVDLSYAGVYQCADADTSSSTAYAFLTVIDPNINCTIIANSSEFNCSFAYSGLPPNLQWNSIGSNSTINCTQEEFNVICIIQFPSLQQNEIIPCHLEIWKGDDSSENGSIKITISNSNSSLFGFLRCQYDKSIGSTTNSVGLYFTVDTTTPDVSQEESMIILIAAISGVVLLGIIVVALLLKRVYSAESKATKGKSDLETRTQTESTEPVYSLAQHIDHDATAPMYSEVKKQKSNCNTPIYAEVKKKGKKSKNDATEHGHVIAETGIYGYALYEHDSADNEQEKGRNNSSDRVIYSELQCVGSSDGTQRPVFVVREGFDRSDYVSVDHSFKAPPAPPHKSRYQ